MVSQKIHCLLFNVLCVPDRNVFYYTILNCKSQHFFQKIFKFFSYFFHKAKFGTFLPLYFSIFLCFELFVFRFSFNFATIFHFTFICFFICIYLSLFYVYLLLFIRLKYFSLLIIVFLKIIHCYKLNKKTLILFIIFH